MGGRYAGCTGRVGCNAIIKSPLGSSEVSLVGAGATVDESGLPPVREEYDINLQPASKIALTWFDAVFVQESPLLGPMWMRLSPTRVSQNSLESVNLGQPSFFPARSRTEFFWVAELPRLGWRLENNSPMVTESIPPHLLSYPVQRAWYRVPTATRFSFTNGRFLRSRKVTISTDRPVVIEPLSDFITASLRLVGKAGNRFSLRATINPYNHVPGPRKIRVAWYIRDWYAGGDPDRPTRGFANMTRGKSTTVDVSWTRASPPTRPNPALTFVVLSLDPTLPGHAEAELGL